MASSYGIIFVKGVNWRLLDAPPTLFSLNIYTILFKMRFYFDVAQIFKLKRVGGTPRGHHFAPLIFVIDARFFIQALLVAMCKMMLRQERESWSIVFHHNVAALRKNENIIPHFSYMSWLNANIVAQISQC